MARTYDARTDAFGFRFRGVEQTRRELQKINDTVEELILELDVRELMMEMFVASMLDRGESFAQDVLGIVKDAENGLQRLRALEGLVDTMLEEWRDVKCAVFT